MNAVVKCTWKVECIRRQELIWAVGFDNLVVTAGLNQLLDATFKTGLASPSWYVGLVNGATTPTYAAADTMGSHAGWTSETSWSASTRPAFTPGTISAGAVDNSAAKAAFTMTGTATIAGCFLTDSNVKTGTTGTLYSVGSFTGGNQAVVATDLLNVTLTIQVTSGATSTGFMPIKEQVFGEFHP